MSKHIAGSQVVKKRRIMRSLKINEISGVDVPAQEGALSVIMKRNTPQTEPDIAKASAITSPEDGHSHLLVLNGPPDGVELNSGFTEWADDHLHPWVRIVGGEIVIGTAHRENGSPHIHRLAFLGKVGEVANFLNQTAGKSSTKENNVMADKDAPTVEEMQKLTLKLERSTSINALDVVTKAHFDGLDDEKAQDDFLAKSSDERKTEIEKLAKAIVDEDPVVYTTAEGLEIRKSAGEVTLAIAKSNDKLMVTNQKLLEKSENTDLEKRAETDLAHMPGDLSTRVALLKSVDSIKDDDQREAALKSLKAQDTALAKAFETLGHMGGAAPGSSADDLEKLAKAYQKENSDLTIEQAYTKVLETPQGQELYNKSVN